MVSIETVCCYRHSRAAFTDEVKSGLCVRHIYEQVILTNHIMNVLLLEKSRFCSSAHLLFTHLVTKYADIASLSLNSNTGKDINMLVLCESV